MLESERIKELEEENRRLTAIIEEYQKVDAEKAKRESKRGMKRFVDAASRKSPPFTRHLSDRIPGTDKIRTYVSNPLVYSRESDLDKITKMPYDNTENKKNNITQGDTYD